MRGDNMHHLQNSLQQMPVWFRKCI
uniref:Rho GTPase-activating protein gacQ n=1 Tax=Rhizophora mucronata TaxID=61149 RepID=A0A2P2MTG9_RHIMU